MLVTAEGGRGLAAAASCRQPVEPAALDRLRRTFPADLVRAALALAGLRVRARERFSRADAMFFDGADALEQASGEAVAAHKAARFAGEGVVVDLCCGVGGDAVMMAGRAGRVIGVDRSLVRLLCLRANAGVYGFERQVSVVAADAEHWAGGGDACHIDPPRRDERGRRHLARAGWDEWIGRVRGLAGRYRHLGGKFSPAVDLAQLDWADEVELISENGTLKQAMTWCGRLARSRRSATVIRSAGGQARAAETLASDEPVGTPRAAGTLAAGTILHEPDAAVVRAGLLGNLAERLGAGLVDPHLPLLAGARNEGRGDETLLARRYEVLEVAGWSIKRVKALVRQRGWRVAEVKTRAFAAQPEEILSGLRSVKTEADAPAVVLWAVRLGDRPMCILTRRL